MIKTKSIENCTFKPEKKEEQNKIESKRPAFCELKLSSFKLFVRSCSLFNFSFIFYA